MTTPAQVDAATDTRPLLFGLARRTPNFWAPASARAPFQIKSGSTRVATPGQERRADSHGCAPGLIHPGRWHNALAKVPPGGHHRRASRRRAAGRRDPGSWHDAPERSCRFGLTCRRRVAPRTTRETECSSADAAASSAVVGGGRTWRQGQGQRQDEQAQTEADQSRDRRSENSSSITSTAALPAAQPSSRAPAPGRGSSQVVRACSTSSTSWPRCTSKGWDRRGIQRRQGRSCSAT